MHIMVVKTTGIWLYFKVCMDLDSKGIDFYNILWFINKNVNDKVGLEMF